MSKTVASALYIEMRRATATAQILIIPPMKHPVRGTDLPAHVLTRQISDSNPRRAWKFYTTSFSDFPEGTPKNESAMHATKYVNDITPYFAGFASGGWVVYKDPIAVEMSLDDLEEVVATDTPNPLLRRVLRARTEAGYEESLFATA